MTVTNGAHNGTDRKTVKIVIDKDAYHKEAENFSLVVSSYNGKSVVVIDFAVPLDWAISSVDLDKLEIAF